MPSGSRLSVLAGLLIAGLGISLAPGESAAAGKENASAADSLSGLIDSLRVQVRYGEAAGVARELLMDLRADSTAKSYEIADAERLIGTLEFAAGLPESSRAELAEADGLKETLSIAYGGGDYASAERYVRRQLETRQRLLGLEHPDVSSSLNNLAVVLSARGDYSGAELLYRESLAMRRKLLGAEHPDVAWSLNDLAGLLRDRGDYAGAEPLQRESLALRRKLLGAEHPDVARSLNALALILKGRGDYSGAETLYRESLAMYRMLLGAEHVDVAMSLNNLAGLLTDLGDYAGAEPLFRESLAIIRKLLGAEHPYVAKSLNNLAGLLMDLGDYAGAEPLYRESLAMNRKLLGAEHPVAATSLNNLAKLLQDRGDYAGAEPLYREALAVFRKLLGAEHPHLALSLNNLARLLHDRGDYAGAELLFRESLAMRRRLLGAEHPDVAWSLNNLAGLLKDRGDYAGAEPLFRESLAMRRRLLGAEHPYVATSLNNLAGLLKDRGDYAGAEPLFRESLAMRRKLLGAEHPDVASSLNSLAALLRYSGDYASAESLWIEAADVFEVARLRVGPGTARATFLEVSPYPDLAAMHLLLNKESAAWPAVERSQGRVLAELLMTAEARGLSATEAKEEKALRLALGDRERRLAAYQQAAQSDSSAEAHARVEEARLRLLEAEAQWSSFERAIADAHPVTEGQSYELARVQAALGEDEAIVGWLDASWGPAAQPTRHSWGYVIRNFGPVAWEDLPPAASLAERFRVALTAPQRSGREDAGQSAGMQRTRYEGLGRELLAERVEPLLPHLDGVKNLIVIPSGEMLGVPVEAMPLEGGRLLSDRFAVAYAPSATVLTWLRERSPAGESSALELAAREKRGAWSDATALLLVGDPPFTEAQRQEMEQEQERDEEEEQVPVAGWGLADLILALSDTTLMRSAATGNEESLAQVPRLPATRLEVASLERLSRRAVTLLGPEASEQRLAELARSGELRKFRAIHLATHAWQHPQWPEQSCLLLSRVDLPAPLEAAEKGERIYDGLLTLSEILREWELDAELVTLSGCETALGQSVSGEGYIGFAHAFLQAGARSVLVSLWRVEDQATALLMERFYSNLFGGAGDARNPGGSGRSGMTKREALREAKAWLRGYEDEAGRHPYADPFFWAPFVLIGDPD